MSQYSELMGSFLRTGNYPLEANYVFTTEEELKEFYEDPINATTLHKGLLKVVENDGEGKLALYWVVKKQTNDELEFVKLIENLSIDNIESQLADLYSKLEEEINTRKEDDEAIWGTNDPTNVPDDLNSLYDLANAVTALLSELEKLRYEVLESDTSIKAEVEALAGTLENDVIAYLKTLPYLSLTEVANALDKFLNLTDSSSNQINTLPELQAFLEGYTDTDTLVNILENLWQRIEGDVTPSELFQTLRGIEDFVRTLALYVKNRADNLQTELDQTQVGVGLSGDGSYSADKETYYLQDATSVMNALKTLDELVHKALLGITITADNLDVVDLYVRKELEGYVIAAKLLLSNVYGNELIKKDDGLYFNVITEYADGILTLKVNDNIVSQHTLGFSSIVEDAKYDPTQEAIVIVFKLLDGEKQTITIPVDALIREWDPDNTNPDRVVELYRDEVVNGNDKVSADVRIAEDTENILEKLGNTLIVRGTSEKITHNGCSLSAVLESIKSNGLELESNLLAEISRAETAESTITDNLKLEVSRANESEQNITSLLNNHKLDHDNPHQVTKELVGLGNVDNTSDTDKPVSTLQIKALKILKDIIDDYTINSYKISSSPVLQKSDIGLDLVDNTSDLNKPISTVTQAALKLKANIESPTLTGVPLVADSPDWNDSSQRIPSTNWVNMRIRGGLKKLLLEIKLEIEVDLSTKADLVDGKVPLEQLPESTLLWIEVESETDTGTDTESTSESTTELETLVKTETE